MFHMLPLSTGAAGRYMGTGVGSEQAGDHVGNFASSLSHSCSPNCTTATAVRNGRICVTLTTTRAIAYGKKRDEKGSERQTFV